MKGRAEERHARGRVRERTSCGVREAVRGEEEEEEEEEREGTLSRRRRNRPPRQRGEPCRCINRSTEVKLHDMT